MNVCVHMHIHIHVGFIKGGSAGGLQEPSEAAEPSEAPDARGRKRAGQKKTGAQKRREIRLIGGRLKEGDRVPLKGFGVDGSRFKVDP